jgi:exopolysaccharide biosynthesis polyprenyl glycosylphosphotransferase
MGQADLLSAETDVYQAPSLTDLRIPVPRGLVPDPVQQAKRQRLLIRGMISTAATVPLSIVSGFVAYAVAGDSMSTTSWASIVALIGLTRAVFYWRKFHGDVSRSLGLNEEVIASVKICTVGSIFGVLAMMMLESSMQVSELSGLLFVEWLVALASWATFLVALKKSADYFRRHGRNIRKVLVVGTNSTSRHLIEHLSSHPETGYRIGGVIPLRLSTEPSLVPLIGNGDGVEPASPSDAATQWSSFMRDGENARDLPTLITDLSIDDLVFASPLPRHQVTRLLTFCDPTLTVSQLLPAADAPTIRAGALLAGFPVVDLLLPSLPPSSAMLKRAMDAAVASIALVLASPFLALAVLAVRSTSPGPALFKQPRIGEHGRPFTIYKLRTMLVDTDPDLHEEYVRRLMVGTVVESNEGIYKPDSSRVTPIGRWLRRLSIDELPQLWNVLTGSMTLVGPRPPMHYEIPMHDARQLRRLDVKPGLTGLWQVSERNNVGYREMVELDLQYIKNWSFANDVRIILRTPRAVFRDRATS